MYISNQKRLLRYRKDRDAEERNSDATQLRLYELLAQEAGEEEQASRLANMARRIGSQILDPSEPSEAVGSIDPIVAAIKGKYLDKLIKEFRALPSSSLSPALQNIQRNLSHATFRSKLNERMAEMKAKNASAIEFSQAFLDKVAAGDPEAKKEFMKVQRKLQKQLKHSDWRTWLGTYGNIWQQLILVSPKQQRRAQLLSEQLSNLKE
ncbi:hypothetical protein GN958_ATG23304 [Phytophthora infestans]|uniref:Uncharacterized protein n=1 Tax=Phytophthora infestans TaxID=4787 RepID=A0A8S9TLB6_PHYIN|nr:hypothetical protein GN958_ATG23304 [Phytophthora infestans]